MNEIKGSDRRKYANYTTACYTKFGACDAIYENIRQALLEECYEQLEDDFMRYKDVTVIEYFEILDERWCKMVTKTRNIMRAEIYKP